jgi:hypothetical protein
VIIPPPPGPLPAVDQRLVAPASRHEILNGKVMSLPPLGGEVLARANALVDAHRAHGYSVALFLLTRTSIIDDLAPDLSVLPDVTEPETEGRRIQELAFMVASGDALDVAGVKASKLVARGVRRAFAIDFVAEQILEWSMADGWCALDPSGQLDDRALARPIPLVAFLREARATP